MASENRPKKKKYSDLLTDHDEWVQHMYSSGYFINRISWATKGQWKWMRSHPKISGAFIAIPFGIGLFSIFYMVISEVIDRQATLLSGIFVLFTTIPIFILFIAGIILFFKAPVHDKENIGSPPLNKEKHKKQPKRRKDYH